MSNTTTSKLNPAVRPSTKSHSARSSAATDFAEAPADGVSSAVAPCGTSPVRLPRSEKIADHHLQRQAVVYVRQSTQQQVLEHRESTARQYGLAERAVTLGWPRMAVEVIDEDQGQSGSSVEGRSGFQRLLAEVSANRVGLILGLEMSRLARSCKDWHALLELCAIYRTLLADADPRKKIAGRPTTGRTLNSYDECRVLIRDRFPAYITWDEFEEIQRKLTENSPAPRRAAQLAQSLPQ